MTKKDTHDKTLDQVLQDIEKQFGKGSIMVLGENSLFFSHVTYSLMLSREKASNVTFSSVRDLTSSKKERYVFNDCLYASTDLSERFLTAGI